MEDHKDTTIRDARQYVNSQLEKGKAAKCPCCTQTVKIYKRKIYSTMARGLIELYKLGLPQGGGYFHISDIESMRKSGGGDFAKLVYWGLVEEAPAELAMPIQRTSGYWKITGKGAQFVEELITVPEYVEVFNKRALRISGKPIGIQDALGAGFNYSELMTS